MGEISQEYASGHVYFQPPTGFMMKYPCIVYKFVGTYTIHAGNKIYLSRNRYEVTCIYNDPDIEIPQKVAQMPTSKHIRHFVKNNLYHDVFTIYD